MTRRSSHAAAAAALRFYLHLAAGDVFMYHTASFPSHSDWEDRAPLAVISLLILC